MAAETTSSFGAVTKGAGVLFKEFFDQNILNITDDWAPVVKYERGEQFIDTFSGKTGSGTLTLTAEGATFSTKNRYKLYDTAGTQKQYTGLLEISRQQLNYRNFSDKFDEFKDLTRSLNVTLSKAPAQIFNNAFSNSGTATVAGVSVVTYADGKNLASTAHPRVNGETAQSNASSTGLPFNEVNFETGRVALAKQLQDDGTPIMAMGDVYAVVPIALEKTAMIITKSEQRSGTANNDVNIYSGGAYKVMSSKWLDSGMSASGVGSDTAWFLVAPNVARLTITKGSGPELDQTVDKNTKSSIFTIVQDFFVLSKDWRGVWGSKGDSLAYSS